MKRAINDFLYLESKVFTIVVDGASFKVEFKLCELPNDMKMLFCFLGGELSNSATYFTTFANVYKDESLDIDKSFGVEWKPFTYEKRLSDSLKVKKKVSQLEKTNLAESTKKQKVNEFIRSLQSRQYEEPLVKHFVDVMKSDPLYLKNNVCKDLFLKVWNTIYKSFPNLPKYKLYKHLPESNIFACLVSFVHNEMKYIRKQKKYIPNSLDNCCKNCGIALR